MDNIIEKRYTKETDIGHRKKFAQFFTPFEIAQFMSRWILENQKVHTILEPAFGLGVFSRALLENKADLMITGYELDANILKCAYNVFKQEPNVALHLQDYIQSDWNNKYDGIICNPPYFKFHDYDNKTAISSIKERLGYNLSGFTNLYAIFLLVSINQLNKNGRCAYIVPSEFLNSDYGIAVKQYLLESHKLRHIIVFDFEEDVFENAITTASIILCSNDDSNSLVSFSLIKNKQQLKELEPLLFDKTSNSITCEPPLPEGVGFLVKEIPYEDINPSIKWRNYYACTGEKTYHNLVPFTKFARVSRGIATGAIDYFSFTERKAKDLGIPESSLLPCICHCSDVSSVCFTDLDFEALSKQNKNVYLFDGERNPNNKYVQEYINKGIELGINKKYLTSSRKPWYALEKRLPPPIWATVFNRGGLRFIRNASKATNLNTFHSVYVLEEYIDYTDLLFAYLLTKTAHDIFDINRREYGNGLKKFEPNDLNQTNILDLTIVSEKDKIGLLDCLSRYKSGNSKSLIEMDAIVKQYVVGFDNF